MLDVSSVLLSLLASVLATPMRQVALSPARAPVRAEPYWVANFPFRMGDGEMSFALIGDVDVDGVRDVAVGDAVQHDWMSDEPWIKGLVLVLSGRDGHELDRLEEPHDRLPERVMQGMWGLHMRNVGDLDSDGHEDLCLGEYFDHDERINELAAWTLLTRSLRWGRALPVGAVGVHDFIGLDDVDRDGGADVLLCASSPSSTWSAGAHMNEHFVLQARNGRTGRDLYAAKFDAMPTGAFLWPSLQSVDDMDGDGRRDVLVAPVGDALGMVASGASGGWISSIAMPECWRGEHVLEVRVFDDVDGDGQRDLLVHVASHTNSNDGVLAVVSMDGRWVSELVGGCAYGIPLSFIVVDDVNEDGMADLVVRPNHYEGRVLDVVSGRTGERLGAIEAPPTVDGVVPLFDDALESLADLDGDGRREFVAQVGRWRFDEQGERLPIVGWQVVVYHWARISAK